MNGSERLYACLLGERIKGNADKNLDQNSSGRGLGYVLAKRDQQGFKSLRPVEVNQWYGSNTGLSGACHTEAMDSRTKRNWLLLRTSPSVSLTGHKKATRSVKGSAVIKLSKTESPVSRRFRVRRGYFVRAKNDHTIKFIISMAINALIIEMPIKTGMRLALVPITPKHRPMY